MKIFQKEIFIQAKKRGYHLITSEVESQIPELRDFKVGLIHLFIKHTSASLTINENFDYTVRDDFETFFNYIIPENFKFFRHNSEGSDDMPAHLKASIIGNSITIPVSNGELNLGTWQGIYLCEHRNHGGNRKLIATILGE